MNFNQDDYTENIDYCEYVFNKNKAFKLGLDNPVDIQTVANIYVDEIIELNDGYLGYDLVENDLVLFEVVDEFLRKIKKNKYDPVRIDYKSDEDLMNYSHYERVKSSRGGYSFNESFDDFGLDNVKIRWFFKDMSIN